MHRTVTAIYRSHSVADLVRQELEGLGISRSHIAVLPDEADTTPGTTRAEDDPVFDRLHDLHLDENDARTYRQAIRSGDHVVSVDVDDDTHLARVQDIMRRPEDARNLDELDRDHASSDPIAPRPGGGARDERQLGRREQTQDSPYVRSYSREQPVSPRKPY